jgi:hypothetical protein
MCSHCVQARLSGGLCGVMQEVDVVCTASGFSSFDVASYWVGSVGQVRVHAVSYAKAFSISISR